MNRLRPGRPALRTAAGAAAGLAAAALAAGLLVAPASADAATVSATVSATAGRTVVSADSFIESVGVNIHSYYNDTSYGDTDRMISLLQQLGVRHVRDGLVPNRPDEVAALRRLGEAGIRSSLIIGGTAASGSQTVDPAQLSALAEVAPWTDAVEPTNEYDCSGDQSWVAHQRAYAQTLVQRLQSSDTLRPLGVFGPAFCRPDSVAQFGSVSGIASVSNAHTYAGGQAPELALAGRLPAWSATQGGSLPMVVTETGYSNALNMTPTQNAVTETTAADYTVRSLLEATRLGVARTYLYELMDEKPEPGLRDPEQHFGLVRVDGTPKPAFTAVRNLLSDVALGSPATVTGAGANTTSDVVSVSGGGSLLRSVSITDPTGGGETLALWLASPLENPTTHQRLTDTARTVRVQLSGAHDATTRRPSRGNAEVALGAGSAFTIPVDGGVTLLHLTPSTAPATLASTTCTPQPSYGALAGSLGAVATSDLAPGAGWTGSPTAATGLPAGTATGTRISANGQQRRVAVPGAPTSWTVALWERTDAGAANFATFLHAVGAPGALLRTYDTASDLPSHMQLSAYGLPASGASFGTETWGQAQPGGWHLVSLSVGGGSAVFSVDGVVQGSVASGGGALTGVDVGAVTSGFRGSLAGLSVFPRALGADELSRLATTSSASCVQATPAVDGTATAPTRTPPATTTAKTYGISSAAAEHR